MKPLKRATLRILPLVLILVPTLSQAAVVVSSNSHATEAAMSVLKSGGSASDAACAASFVLGVTQSYFTGIGGGGFALISPGESGSLTSFYDFREVAPIGVKKTHFSEKLSGLKKRDPYGVHGVGVPGLIKGCEHLRKHFGKISWERALNPSVGFARDGFKISEEYADWFKDEWKRLSKVPVTSDIFKGESGDGVSAGEHLKQPDLAKTLSHIAENGAQSFYEGEFAEAWIKSAQSAGVMLSAQDLKSYRVEKLTPPRFTAFGVQFVTSPAPSGGGLVVGSTLRYIEHAYKKNGKPAPDSVERYLTTLEALRFFQKIRNSKIGDSKTSRLDPATYFGSKQEQKDFALIDSALKAKINRVANVGIKEIKTTKSRSTATQKKVKDHTAHVVVIDDDGKVASLTSSVNGMFGSGVTVPNNGFLLNNTLGDFSTSPTDINAPLAGLRPRSNMTPTIGFDASGKPLVVIGGAGGSLIPVGMIQVIENFYVHKMPIAEASAFARVELDSEVDVTADKGLTPATLTSLQKAGFKVSEDTVWALIQVAARASSADSWQAAHDPRAEGLALTK